MSLWADVFGTIEVIVPAETKTEVAYLVDTVLGSLPAIKGSNGEAEISVHVSDVHYRTKCGVNRWDQRSDRGTSKRIKFKSGRTYHEYRCYDHATITVVGHLRDCMYEETLRMVTKFLQRLSKRLEVVNILLRVSSQYSDDEFVFDNNTYNWSENYDFNDPWLLKYLHTSYDYYKLQKEEEDEFD